MAERRRENLEWLESVVRRNPGVSLFKLVARFSRLTGLRRTTVMEYVKTLEQAKLVREYYGKLYPVEKLPTQ